jgi:recombinational DNA repair protein RecT
VRGDRGKIIASYSIAVMKGGEISREVMWVDEIEAIRALSKSGDSGPWKTHYGEMCKKTVARRHAKVLPMSTDLDDMLRQGDEDPAPIERAPGRNLTDALNMIASLPQGEAPPAEQANSTLQQMDQLDLVDAVNAIEEVDHESDRKAG